jgi:4-hydroxy-tetrahydrodipicolinate synthase
MAEFDVRATGVYVIAATPFTDDGEIDYGSTDRMLDFYVSAGASGITILGMMGEAPKLSAAESEAFVRHVVGRVGAKLPVIVGVSSPGFAAMQALAQSSVDAGAAGVMVAPPPTLRTDDQIARYFNQVGKALGEIPFVLQDFPLSTGVQIAPSVINRIIADVPTCVMLKHEDWPGLNKISALRAASDAGAVRRISILVGNAGVFLPEELGRGADGAMTGFAYPEMMVGVCAAHAAGDIERAHDLFDAYLPLMRYEQQPNLGLSVRKYVLARRGIIASAALRQPGEPLRPVDIAEVERLLDRQARRLQELGA